MKGWLIIGLLLTQVSAVGQEADKPRPPAGERMAALREKALRLIRAAEALGNWDEHYEYALDAIERVFERNNWNSESDLFSLEMVREVGAIPPWEVQERFNKAVEMVGDRYLLDEGQMAALQHQALKINVGLFSRHSDRILQYALEAVQTRAAGEPFTPEQVARWTELAEPVFQDARQSVNAAAKQFMEQLDPEQRELLQRDLDAANRRMADIERLGAKWKRGQWDPHDWGMEDDPIQNQWARGPEAPATGGAEARPESPPAPAAPASAAQPPPSEREQATQQPKADDPWAKYVRAFIKKYQLNDEQQQRAWLFYRDAKERDELFAKRHDRRTAALRTKAGKSDDERTRAALHAENEKRRSESERLFNLLKRRLERLPTRAQRKNAEPGEINVPDSSTQKKAEAKKKP